MRRSALVKIRRLSIPWPTKLLSSRMLDRRTLFIELQENPGHLDQVRVLVEAEE